MNAGNVAAVAIEKNHNVGIRAKAHERRQRTRVRIRAAPVTTRAGFTRAFGRVDRCCRYRRRSPR